MLLHSHYSIQANDKTWKTALYTSIFSHITKIHTVRCLSVKEWNWWIWSLEIAHKNAANIICIILVFSITTQTDKQLWNLAAKTFCWVVLCTTYSMRYICTKHLWYWTKSLGMFQKCKKKKVAHIKFPSQEGQKYNFTY